ncbi:MAG: dTDP-4-dehydrorhamnose 3,5-epimerase [Proteobacteria bacterium]|nr:dTDP-4-dehydrorhamnose 3,5-epimerase [Pseudomonadota bacterium]
MNVLTTPLEGVLVVEPHVFGDQRGYFLETYSHERYKQHGIKEEFVQDNVSFSGQGVLRGLHFQRVQPQGKLVYVLSGEVFDVAVDIRVGSPTFGKWHGVTLSSENKKQYYVPPNFAHGFVVLSETALFAYKCTDYYSPETEVAIRFDDPEIGITWPLEAPVLSDKDRQALLLKDIARELLPVYSKQNAHT